MSMNQHEVFMEMAAKLAYDNVFSGQGGPFGAVIVKDGKVLATGVNQVLGHADPTAHAEVQAIRAAAKELGSFELRGCVLYTSCEPCPMCLGAIYWSRIDHFYYANTRYDAAAIDFDDSLIYEEIGRAPGERSVKGLHLENASAKESFAAWASKQDRIPY